MVVLVITYNEIFSICNKRFPVVMSEALDELGKIDETTNIMKGEI